MTTTSPTDGALAPNHHADYPTFGGLSGFAAALTFAVGRGEVADLAARLAAVGPGDDVVDVGCGRVSPSATPGPPAPPRPSASTPHR